MANSKFEYVRAFERSDILLPNTWIVVRIDGRGFHKFSTKHAFQKPNDPRALALMNAAASGVLKELPDLVLGYGVSDEYSFVFHKDCTLFERREAKLTSTVVSTFTAYYVHLWPTYFVDSPLSMPLPSFDGRAVCYPSVGNLRDYCAWRQADCHINNLYNTTFWTLIQQGGMDAKEAEKELVGTVAADKNEILFSRFGINYNNEPDIYKKGSVVFRDYDVAAPTPSTASNTSTSTSTPTTSAATSTSTASSASRAQLNDHLGPARASAETAALQDAAAAPAPAPLSRTQQDRERRRRAKAHIAVAHCDIIRDDFWAARPWILSGSAPRGVEKGD